MCNSAHTRELCLDKTSRSNKLSGAYKARENSLAQCVEYKEKGLVKLKPSFQGKERMDRMDQG